MRITVLAPGSRGDVQPFAALGGALARAGHEIRIVADRGFAPLMRLAGGVEHVPVSGDIRSLLQAERKLVFEQGRNPVALARSFFKVGRDLALRWGEEGLAACRGADAILTGDGAAFFGASVAEKSGVPLIQTYLQPLPPTRDFPSALIPQPPFRLPGWANRISHRLVGELFWLALRPGTNEARRRLLGLRPWPVLPAPVDAINRRGPLALFGFSPSVVPRPADWPPQCRVTGYWFLDDPEWRTPPELEAFLAAGPPPVYVGFGSMGAADDPRETTALVLQALKEAGGLRAVLAAGWGGLSCSGVGGDAGLPETVIMIEEAPHDRLLPRMAAAVHHGGAGTTAAALRAGIPSIVLPVLGDQSFWGARLAALGAAPPPLPRRRVTAEALAASLRRVTTDTAMRVRAAQLGKAIRAEDGLKVAVALIEDMIGTGAVRSPRRAREVQVR
ncbi:MAG TPA: glycosyltransferase [Stellaceae bacterium]